MLSQQRLEEFTRRVRDLHATDPHPVVFFNHVMHTLVPVMFPDLDPGTLYATEAWDVFMSLHGELRQSLEEAGRPEKVITVRLSRKLHELLQAQAHAHQMSMNRLCVTYLGRGLEHDREIPAGEKGHPCNSTSTSTTHAASSDAPADAG